VLKVTARAAADLTEIQANTAALFYRKIRRIIAEKLETEASEFTGEIELDESYFGGIRKGKRGRGAAGKVPVFGILKRGGKVAFPPKTDPCVVLGFGSKTLCLGGDKWARKRIHQSR
jgi:transposase-like protein